MKNAESVQDNLETRLEQLKKVKVDMTKSKVEVGTVRKQIENETASMTKWLADNIFRTDNPQRKAAAIEALSELDRMLDTAIDRADKLLNESVDLKLILIQMREWSDCIKDLIPVLELQMSIPDFSDTFSDIWDAILGVATLINTALLGAALSSGPVGWAAVGIGVAIEAALALIGGIIAGEERKNSFEDIKKKAEEGQRTIQDKVINSIDDALQKTDTFFSSTARSLKEAGLCDTAVMSHVDIRRTIEDRIVEIRLWRSGYNTTIALIEKGYAPKKAAKLGAETVARNEPAKISELTRLFYASYMYNNNTSIDDIAKELEIGASSAKKLKVRKMLMDGAPPAEIARVLDLPVSEVRLFKKASDQFNADLESLGLAA